MTDSHLPDAPVYIGGLERSGKTYVRLMLAAHPALAFSKRTRLWTHIYGRFGDLADPANFDRCLAAARKNKHVRALEPDGERLRREFGRGAGGPDAYAYLFALLHRHYAERLGKARWGDQTQSVEDYTEAIFAAFPAARIIHLLRDPRDWYEAVVARDGRRPGRLGDAVARWSHSAELALQHERRHPDRYKALRYEMMVSQPAETLREIGAFLGLKITPEATAAMLSLGHAARFGDNPSPLSTTYIGRFRDQLAPREWGYIQERTAKLMAAFDYAPEPAHLSPVDRLRARAIAPAASLMARGSALQRVLRGAR